jgi:hypothetical protein
MTPRQRRDTHPHALVVAVFVALAPTDTHAAPRFERVLERACRALALDREPYVAALGEDAVTVLDKRGQHDEKLPDALRGSGLALGVFFGRDYRVRVAGTAVTPSGNEVRYYRSLPGGLKSALDELGPLGARGGPGLAALLGTADPEIVCRFGQSCLIKRISGWSKASAPNGLERVGLSLGTGWALAGTSLFTLDKDWSPLAAPGPWRKADDAFVRGEHACVVERGVSRLHHFDGRAWHSSPSPIPGPRSLWGSADSFWVAGDGGAATLQGEAFEKVEGVGSIAQVIGRSGRDVWLCGANGVFRSRP